MKIKRGAIVQLVFNKFSGHHVSQPHHQLFSQKLGVKAELFLIDNVKFFATCGNSCHLFFLIT